jgi:hypothetical protein
MCKQKGKGECKEKKVRNGEWKSEMGWGKGRKLKKEKVEKKRRRKRGKRKKPEK